MDCVEVCPVDCFYEGENVLVIHPDECIDCGVCEPECPVDAIKPDTEPGLEKWLLLNAEYAKIWPNITVKSSAASVEPAADARLLWPKLTCATSPSISGPSIRRLTAYCASYWSSTVRSSSASTRTSAFCTAGPSRSSRAE